MRATDIPQVDAFPEGTKLLGLVETEPGTKRLRLGPTGTGPAGPAGATGAQGPAGPEGATGAQGPAGSMPTLRSTALSFHQSSNEGYYSADGEILTEFPLIKSPSFPLSIACRFKQNGLVIREVEGIDGSTSNECIYFEASMVENLPTGTYDLEVDVYRTGESDKLCNTVTFVATHV